MDRKEFEYLRDLPDKVIEEDIVLQRAKETAPLLSATAIIRNSASVDARVRIELNEKTDAKTVNVFLPGVGPICRLDIDTRPHKKYGDSHKHSLKEPDCAHPSVNLGRLIDERSDLSGKTIQEIFTDFCQKANIIFQGVIKVSD